MEQTLRLAPMASAYFWATQGGAELDLMLLLDGKRIGFEFKYSENPTTTRSMRVAAEDLRLDQLWIVCPGNAKVRLEPKLEIRGIQRLPEIL